MGISFEHNVIFVHIPKTGGQSLHKGLGISLNEKMLYGWGSGEQRNMELSHLTAAEGTWDRLFEFTQKERNHYQTQSLFVYDAAGKSLVDKIFRFENFDEISQWLKIKTGKDMPFINKAKSYNYMDYYSDRTKKIVAKLYEDDFKNFNYQI